MIINKIIINNGLFDPTTITFGKNTLITSDENARGKTTLIRYILFALGYKIPSTKKIRMEDNGTIISISNSCSNLIIERSRDYLTIKYEDETLQEFDLTLERDQQTVHSIIFETENYNLLNNLLMIFYIDQDKGWTLLNRGKCIGNNRFDVRDFVAALSGVNVSSINDEIDVIDREIKKYNALKAVLALKDAFEEEEIVKNDNDKIEEKNKLLLLKSELLKDKAFVEKNLKELQDLFHKNKSLVDYVASYNLLISNDNGEPFKLTSQNIVDFEVNQNILKYQLKQEAFRLNQLDKDLSEINSKLKEFEQLFDVRSASSIVVSSIMTTSIDTITLARIITDLGKQKANLKRQKTEKVASSQKVVSDISELVVEFTKTLGVYDNLYGKEKNGIFTSNLKEYSGTILHKIVFSFRLAFCYIVSEILNIKVPLIIDSPGSAEVKLDNVKEMINLAKNKLSNSQIIISSVFEEVADVFGEDIKVIMLDDMLMNKTEY